MDKRKMANNILEYMINPTIVPVEKRLYFGPEEKLDNRSYEKAKSDAFLAYRHQRQNSDMYPTRNKKLTRMGGFSMDRKTLIASLDILAQKFSSSEDPISMDLRTMAHVVAKMPEEEYGARIVAEEAPAPEAPAPEETKTAKSNPWMDAMAEARKKNPGKSFKEIAEAAKKIYKKEATDEEMKQAEKMMATEEAKVPSIDTWSDKAATAVRAALIEDVVGTPVEAGKKKGPGKPDGTGPFGGTEKCPMTEKKEDGTPVEAGKKKGPGKPDGTGPFGGTEKCPMTEEKESSDEKAEKVEEKAKDLLGEAEEMEKGDSPKDEAKAEKKEEKAKELLEKAEKDEKTKGASEEEEKTAEENKIVDTDILAKEKFSGIELVSGMLDVEDVGELSVEEKSKLDLLFQN